MADADATTVWTPQVVAGWFDEHAAAIGRYAARRVGPTLARDIVGETFRVAYEQFERFDSTRGDARGWLFGIATNLIRRHRRTEDRRLRIQARSVQVEVVPLDPLVRVDEQLDARGRYERVVDVIAQLDEDDRDLLFLVAWEGMTSRQVAGVLGIPPGTVRSRLKRIRAQLAHTIEEGDRHG